MQPSRWLPVALACAAAAFTAEAAWAQAPLSNPEGHYRAGSPTEISPWAHPTDTGRYVGYLVGGGSANYRKGEPPAPDDGTWGWDFQGGFFKRRVILNWWHGRRDQGGVGQYETEHSKRFPPRE